MSDELEIQIEEEIDLKAQEISLKRSKICEDLKSLIDNNCAIIEVFPEADGNRALWIKENIEDHKDVDEAIARLQAIKDKEIELASYVAPPSAKEVIIEKIISEKSPTVAKLMGYLQELIEVI